VEGSCEIDNGPSCSIRSRIISSLADELSSLRRTPFSGVCYETGLSLWM
jgi:hypothetical protein